MMKRRRSLPASSHFYSPLTGDTYSLDVDGNYLGISLNNYSIKQHNTGDMYIRELLCTGLDPERIVDGFYNEDNLWWHYADGRYYLYRDDVLIRRASCISDTIFCYFEIPYKVTIGQPDVIYLDHYAHKLENKDVSRTYTPA